MDVAEHLLRELRNVRAAASAPEGTKSMSYLEKRGQHSTGWWYGEYTHKTAGRFRARFKTKDQADAYEAHIRAFGQEPDWAHTADIEELKGRVEKFSEDLRAADERQRAAEERIRKLEEEVAAEGRAFGPV
jgi:hypothetical protein